MKYTKDYLISFIREDFYKTGKVPTLASIKKKGINWRVWVTIFGSWSFALELAKLPKRILLSKSISYRNNLVEKPKRSRVEYFYKKREDYLARPFEDLSWEAKRFIVLKEQDYKCARCGLDTWQGEKLVLEVDHVDGNNKNNARINLRGFCPNCHSLTPTWRGNNKRKKVSDVDLLEALKTTNSKYAALVKVGMAPKGKNYVRITKLSKSLMGV